jgi:hypothetical protein
VASRTKWQGRARRGRGWALQIGVEAGADSGLGRGRAIDDQTVVAIRPLPATAPPPVAYANAETWSGARKDKTPADIDFAQLIGAPRAAEHRPTPSASTHEPRAPRQQCATRREERGCSWMLRARCPKASGSPTSLDRRHFTSDRRRSMLPRERSTGDRDSTRAPGAVQPGHRAARPAHQAPGAGDGGAAGGQREAGRDACPTGRTESRKRKWGGAGVPACATLFPASCS